MKVVTDYDSLVLYINKNMIDFDIHVKEQIEKFIKAIVIRLRKRGFDISGFYGVKVYQNDNYGMVIDMKKEEELDFFPDLIDLKLVIYYDSDMYIKVDDYFLVCCFDSSFFKDNYWYVNINDLEDKDIIKLLEFGELVYNSN